MLWDIGEPLPGWRAWRSRPRLAGGRAGGTTDVFDDEAQGAAPNAIAAPTRAAAASRGVPVRPAMEVTAVETAALAAAMATPPLGVATMAVEWLTPKGSAAAVAASAAKVFLLPLPGGWPRFRGTSGVAAGSLTLF
jgi:hypothetical protein